MQTLFGLGPYSPKGAQISNPGYPSIDSGGQVFSGGISLEVQL